MNLTIKSPIPAIVKQNSKGLSFQTDKIRLIPYRGGGSGQSHGYLKLLYDLVDLSPSQGTCIKNVVKYGFRSITGFEREGIEGLRFEGEESSKLTLQEIQEMNDTLKEAGMSIKDFLNISKAASFHKGVCGNTYLHYRLTKVGDEVRIMIKPLHPKTVMLVDNDKLYNEVIVADSFGDEVLKDKKKHKRISVFPAFDETRTTKECVFHFKEHTYESEHYGMPSTLQTIRSQFIEYALTELSTKVSGKNEVSSKAFAVSMNDLVNDVNKEGGENEVVENLKKYAKQLREVTTLEGNNPSTIAVLANPSDKPMQMFDISINRDTNWYKEQLDRHSGFIYAAHGDNRQLTGLSDAKANLGGNVLVTLYEKYNIETIMEHQAIMADFMKMIINQVFEDLGVDKFMDVKPIYENKINMLIDKLNGYANNALGSKTVLAD